MMNLHRVATFTCLLTFTLSAAAQQPVPADGDEAQLLALHLIKDDHLAPMECKLVLSEKVRDSVAVLREIIHEMLTHVFSLE